MTRTELRTRAEQFTDEPCRAFLVKVLDPEPITLGALQQLGFRRMTDKLYSGHGVNVLWDGERWQVGIGVARLLEVTTAGRLTALVLAVCR